MRHETWVDKQIREAQERGDFDNLPGQGGPIPGAGQPYDEGWWVKGLLIREETAGAALPESLQLRREVERLPAVLPTMRSEREVRDAVSQLNARIEKYLRMPTEPFARLSVVDAEATVAEWRAKRHAGRRTAAPSAQRKRRWWWQR
jgi:hypothetical protein